MASNVPRANRASTACSAVRAKPSRRRFIAAGESTLFSTARARVCSGGSRSSTRLGGRQGFSLAKSLIPTPRPEQKPRQSFRTACTSA